MTIAALVPTVPLLAAAYRLRGGSWVSLADWEYRLIWGAALIFSYILCVFPDPNPLYVGMLIPLAYLAMLVPHAYAQNMGRWPTPQNGWPSFFIYTPDQNTWTGWPGWLRTAHDFLCMACVAFFRAAIVFLPFALSTYLAGASIDWLAVLRAVAALTLGQPLAYLLGWYVPFSVGSALTKQSTEWCEFFNGAAWAVALWSL